MLAEIASAAQCAADLAGQMLMYAQKAKTERVPVNLSALIESVWPLLQESVGKNGVLVQDLEADVPAVEGDANQLRDLVMTLVQNASDAIGDGPGTIRVRTRLTHRDFAFAAPAGNSLPEGEYVWLQVTDTGCGMDAETRARIFEPFYSTKFTGRGLAMAAVQGIVHSHQGAISVSSKPGQGATVNVFLPARPIATGN
jgi:signal transduction histidine kinase